MVFNELGKAKTIIKNLTKNGIVRESNSSYSNPVKLVHKKDDSSRLCVDYRAFSRLTTKEWTPLARIEHPIDRLQKKINTISV